MHASYSNHIGYNETPTLPVLNGPPSWVVRSASKKRPIRSSIQTVNKKKEVGKCSGLVSAHSECVCFYSTDKPSQEEICYA